MWTSERNLPQKEWTLWKLKEGNSKHNIEASEDLMQFVIHEFNSLKMSLVLKNIFKLPNLNNFGI